MKPLKKLWMGLLRDLLAAGLLLLIYAFVHHGYAFLKTRFSGMNTASVRGETEVNTDSFQEEVSMKESESSETEISEETSEEDDSAEILNENAAEIAAETSEENAEPDNRTEWQIKFADHFTEEIIQTENSYSSPNVSVTITTHKEEIDGSPVVYYVADVYISSIECFRSYIAYNSASSYAGQDVLEMDAASNAILGMTGDFYSYQYSMLMIRNGVLFRKNQATSDICILYKDGTMKTYGPNEYDHEAVLTDDSIWQLWHFGPSLLDENGEIPESYNASTSITYANPRSSIGYYEPGHYCFIVCDGRQYGWSDGLTAEGIAKIYKELGCTVAYNLDGGGSAVMTFNDDIYSMQSNGNRQLSDIVLIGEPDTWDPETFNTGM